VSESMSLDVDAVDRIAARIDGQHDLVVAQAQAVDRVQAGPACSGRRYPELGERYVRTLRVHLVQALQTLAAETRLVAAAVQASAGDYVGGETAAARRLRS
jgi:hypothetical protein